MTTTVVDERARPTDEQLVAASNNERAVFIEAGPGTGKTTVSALRFGVLRFAERQIADTRPVLAVSFTRAATRTLTRRVQRLWGPEASVWPNRVVTLDTVMADLLHDLMRSGRLVWPGGHTELDVHDSWSIFGGSTFNRTTYTLQLFADGVVRVRRDFVERARSAVPSTGIIPRIEQGICTHDDVRTVLQQALGFAEHRDYVRQRLAQTARALIVDEVFDANDLDITIIELAMEAGLRTTLVGDPWQALYVFRGARPDAVPKLIERTQARTVALKRSFRWKTDEQRDLSARLRAGAPVSLPQLALSTQAGTPAQLTSDLQPHSQPDVVLARQWKPLWEIGGVVLPVAFGSFKGTAEEAAGTLLLNHVTRSVFDLDAVYLRDAMTALAISDPEVLRQLENQFQAVLEMLQQDGRPPLNAGHTQLVSLLGDVSPRSLRPAHHQYTGRLGLIRDRIRSGVRLLPGLTTHQAKGGEWDVVGIHLTDSDRDALSKGLRVSEDTHRQLYVAGTRARFRTVEVSVATEARN